MNNCYVLDGSGYVFRAYYGLPELSNKDGESVHAIYGFFRMLFKLLADKPKEFVIAWDSPWKTLRHEAFENYKMNRPALPDNFKWQIRTIKDLVKQLQIPYLEVPSYEADDIIYSCAKFYNTSITIISSDKDLKQVLSGTINFFDPMKNAIITPKEFIEEFWFIPSSIVDYLALLWDASDNVPGVMGIGKKTAQDLIAKYETIENIYEHLDELSPSVKLKMTEGRETAFKSKNLIQLMEVPGFDSLAAWTFTFNPDFSLYERVLIRDMWFAGLEKAVSELRKSYTNPQQLGLF